MAKLTAFQRLNKVFFSGGNINNYHVQKQPDDDVIIKTNNKEEFDIAALQARQQHLLARQWKRAQYDITNRSLASLNEVKLMYREADIMDMFPEIGTALDIVMEECTSVNDNGSILNITSKSERIKSILQDLFVNRLSIDTMLPMICRGMCKYGNDFLLLNIDSQNGITGWKELPVYEMERYENGMENPYASAYVNLNNINPYANDGTKFVWVGSNEYIPYQDWQVAHFRLLYNSIFLPFGVSFLHKARRHFRLLSMMEDSMLLYRLERAVERRVFKINVGSIDEQDVPAYIQEIANEFKRTPIIDPMTGQIDLRKNVLPVWKNTPIPLLDGRTITIEELSKEYEDGKMNYVYSIQDNTLQLVPGKVVWCGKNYTADNMIKITLNDDSYMVMAPEHEIVMSDGSKKRADKVCEGESVMPFYRVRDTNSRVNDNERTYNPRSGRYEYLCHMVTQEVTKQNKTYRFGSNGEVVSDKRNDGHQTDKRMTVVFDDYMWHKINKAILREIIYNRRTMLEYINTYLFEHLLEINTNKRLRKRGKITYEMLEHNIHEIGFGTITEYIDSVNINIDHVKNVAIKSIEYIGGDDVYCMTVVGLKGEEDRHNFALRTFTKNDEWNDSGCFVSNCNTEDFFIPVRDDNAPNPIETLPAAQNLTAIDDIKFIQNKVFTALRVPKSFLNFEDAQGDGKNLSLLDVRFLKTVNRIQQSLLMELNKIAIIHLILLGFTDELTNFLLTMNNPSSQAEMLSIENLAKKITTAKDAITDSGNGIPLMSVTRAWRTILKWSDKEIADNLEELRLENALAAELKKTTQIIKRTGIFDPIDNVYGESGAEYSDGNPDEEGGDSMVGGAPVGGGAIGGDVDFGDEGDIGEDAMDNGEEGEMDVNAVANEDAAVADNGGNENLGESYMRKLLGETLKRQKKLNKDIDMKKSRYAEMLKKRISEETQKNERENDVERTALYDKNFFINERLNSLQKQLTEIVNKTE